VRSTVPVGGGRSPLAFRRTTHVVKNSLDIAAFAFAFVGIGICSIVLGVVTRNTQFLVVGIGICCVLPILA